MLQKNKGFFAIGNFDGVHKGHQKLLTTLKQLANNKPYGVITFDPHPVVFFKKYTNYLLTSIKERTDLLKSYGVQDVVVLPFKEIYKLSPEEFVKDILVEKLGVTTIITGNNFTFGFGQKGDIHLLTQLTSAYNIEHIIAPDELNSDGVVLSSSFIRKSIQNADLQNVYNMLGRYYKVSGTVVEGNKLARILGFPTANMKLQGFISPKYGVYAVMVWIDGVHYKAVANFGIRPTLKESQEFLEVHIFNYNNNLYDKIIDVEFIKFIRNELKFASLDILKEQIAKDANIAKEILDKIKQ